MKNILNLLILVLTVAGVYFRMEAKVDALQAQCNKNSETLKIHNPEVINTKLDFMMKEQERLNKNVEKFIDIYNNSGL